MDGKVVFITGAARGQGRAHAVRLAAEGAAVVATDVCAPVAAIPYAMASEEDLAETVRQVEALGGSIVAAAADIRDGAALEAAAARGVAEFGGIDGLIANAGVFDVGPFHEISEESWRTLIEVNLTGSWRTAKALAPHLVERGAGSIVFTSSDNGLEAGPMFSHYTASKHALIGLMKGVALELGPSNVRANAICPGPTDTAMVDWPGVNEMVTGRPDATRADADAATAHWMVLPQAGKIPPLSQANAALFLLSDEAEHISGVALTVDRGHYVMPGYDPSDKPVVAN